MKRLRFACIVSILASVVMLALTPLSVAGAAPEAGFVLSTTYPSIVAGKGQDISFPIDIVSKGTADELLDIKVASAPAGWETTLKGSGYGIRSLYLLAGKTQSFTLQVKPPADVAEGDYKLTLQATNSAGVSSTLGLSVGIQAKAVGGIKLATMYPMLRGPSTSPFQFKVDVVNQGDEEATVGLSAVQPQDWQVTIKPSYQDTQISTIRVKPGETQGLDVNITPSSKAEPGQYSIDLQATSGTSKDSIKLQVELTGTSQLSFSTSSGLLNTSATAGQPTNVSVVVTNKGTDVLRNVTFSSSKPDGWEVTFNPDKIDALNAGDSREVNVTLKPSSKAIAGDYAVSLTASSGSTSKDAQLRVTVETPTLWGWAGIILVVIVIGALGGLFSRLGRR